MTVSNQHSNTQDFLRVLANAMKVIPLLAKGPKKKIRKSTERVRSLLDASSRKEDSDLSKAVSDVLSELFERSEDQCATNSVLTRLSEQNARLSEQNARLSEQNADITRQLHEAQHGAQSQVDIANARVEWIRSKVHAHVRRVSKRSGLTGHEQEIAKSLFGSILFDEGGKDLPPEWKTKSAWQGMYSQAEKLRFQGMYSQAEKLRFHSSMMNPESTDDSVKQSNDFDEFTPANLKIQEDYDRLRDAVQNLIFSATGGYWTEDNPDVEELVVTLGELDRSTLCGQMETFRITEALGITGTINTDGIVQRIEALQLSDAECASLRKRVEDLEFQLEQMSAMRAGQEQLHANLYNRLSKALTLDDDVPPNDEDYEDAMIAAVERLVSSADESDRLEAQLESEHNRLAKSLGFISDLTFDDILMSVETHIKRLDLLSNLAEQVASSFGYDQLRGNVEALKADLVKVPFWLNQVKVPK